MKETPRIEIRGGEKESMPAEFQWEVAEMHLHVPLLAPSRTSLSGHLSSQLKLFCELLSLSNHLNVAASLLS